MIQTLWNWCFFPLSFPSCLSEALLLLHPSSFHIPYFNIFLPTCYKFLTVCLSFWCSDRCPCPEKPLKGQPGPTYSGFRQAQGPIHTIAGWSMPPSCFLSCKGSEWACTQFFLISVKKQWYVLAGNFPSCKSFLTQVFIFVFVFSWKLQSYFVLPHTPKVLYHAYPLLCVHFYCFSTHHFHLFLHLFHTPGIYPIYTHFLF